MQVSRARFNVLVDDALDQIPDELMRLVDNVVIQVEDEDPEDPDLLGVYNGIALTERMNDYTFAAPDTITLFRLPLMAMCEDEEELAEEISVTVVHEIAHHFGIDDDRLHDLGWG